MGRPCHERLKMKKKEEGRKHTGREGNRVSSNVHLETNTKSPNHNTL
jgi:hypothetical protein